MKIKTITILLFTTILLSLNSFGQETSSVNITSFLDEQHYNRAINIMAMLLVGFGFLMVFVRKYGRSALTATFLLTSISLPLYFLIKSTGIVGEESEEITKMILAEFGAASLLIAAGAVLGRIKMPQYLLLGLLFIPFYMLNEWIVLDNGLGIIPKG